MIHNARMMSALLAMAALTEEKEGKSGSPMPTKEELERSRLNTEERYKAIMVRKGVKGFYIDGHVVYARNLKNAKRKAKNLNQLN